VGKSLDHRWGSRFNCGTRVELRAPDGARTDAVIRDVSLSGAFVESACELPLMDQVAVRPAAPTARWMRAFVVRSTDGGMALEWFEPGPEAISAFMPAQRDEQPLFQHRTLAYVHAMASTG
jgi:hypothetical protein